jgi:hypothetical protein
VDPSALLMENPDGVDGIDTEHISSAGDNPERTGSGVHRSSADKCEEYGVQLCPAIPCILLSTDSKMRKLETGFPTGSGVGNVPDSRDSGQRRGKLSTTIKARQLPPINDGKGFSIRATSPRASVTASYRSSDLRGEDRQL